MSANVELQEWHCPGSRRVGWHRLFGTAECSVCGVRRVLRNDGLLQLHTAPGKHHPNRMPKPGNRNLRVEIPTVAFKGPNDTDAAIFRRAARNLETGYEAGGGNVKTAVARLLQAAADALEAAGVTDPETSFYDYQRAVGIGGVGDE